MSQDEADYSLQLPPGSGGSPDDPNFHGASPFPKKYVPGQAPTRMLEWYEILLSACEEMGGRFRALNTHTMVPDSRESYTASYDEHIAMMLSPLLAKHNVPVNRRSEIVGRLMLLSPNAPGAHTRESIEALVALYSAA